MEEETGPEMHNAGGDFHSKMRTVPSKNLRNFLELYYLTYIEGGGEKSRAVRRKHRFMLTGARNPKIPPGLRFIQSHLRCTKTTAQGYLRAIQITHDIFVEHELERRSLLKQIDRKDYNGLLRDLSYTFEDIARRLGLRKKGSDKAVVRDFRRSLNVISAIIARASGVLTPKDCAKIFQEFASWMA